MNDRFNLTGFEQELVFSTEMMNAKNCIIQKVVGLFADLSEHYVSIANPALPVHITSVSPKISKGEQYLGLPYVMLDYPRIFSKEQTFAIRTFFWWGHHFSIHLHVSGNYKNQYQSQIKQAINKNQLSNWYVCVNEDEWQHHFEEDNYAPLKQREEAITSLQINFLKVAKKIPLTQWNTSAKTLLESFRLLIRLTGA